MAGLLADHHRRAAADRLWGDGGPGPEAGDTGGARHRAAGRLADTRAAGPGTLPGLSRHQSAAAGRAPSGRSTLPSGNAAKARSSSDLAGLGGPARRGPDRAPSGPPGRDHQAHRHARCTTRSSPCASPNGTHAPRRISQSSLSMVSARNHQPHFTAVRCGHWLKCDRDPAAQIRIICGPSTPLPVTAVELRFVFGPPMRIATGHQLIERDTAAVPCELADMQG